MAFSATIIATHLTDNISVPWQAAPPAVQAAAKAADAAITASLDAAGVLEDATIGIPAAQSEFETAGRAALREGNDLPSRDVLDIAAFTLANAVQDARIAESKMSAARNKLAGLLSDPATREMWTANLERQIAADQIKLSKAADDLAGICAQVAVSLSFTEFIGRWPALLTPPPVTLHDPAGALRRLASAKVWTPPIPPGEARIQEPTEADTRPPVWVVNDSGACHDVVAANVDELLQRPGWRRATVEEGKQQHLRNTGRR